MKKENKNYVSLHTHSTFSIMDSTSTYTQIIDKIKELGMKSLAFTEHGNIYGWINKKQACDKAGIKYIHGIELYMTESLDNKVRDNYHVVLLAKNIDGVHEINELYTKATDENHMYYNPRITFDEFLNTSDNIIRLSACLGGVLHRLDRNHVKYFDLLNKFDYLEVHPHIHPEQLAYNEYLNGIQKPLVACGDFHEVSDYKSQCRLKWMAGKGKKYDDEDAFDLVIKGYDEFREMFIKQGVLSPEVIDTAIENTNKIADMVEDFELDLTFKFPDLYDEPKDLIRRKTFESLDRLIADNLIDESDIDTYIERIETELHAFDVLNMESFILFMSELMTFCMNENIAVGPARGSASGSLVCYLLHVTDVDPIIWGTNFTRFINVNRISLPDIDTDFAPADRIKVFNYIRDRFGIDKSSYITTYQKIGVKKVIEDIARAINMPIPEMAKIKEGYKNIDEREGKLKRKFENGGMSEKEYEEEMSILEKEMEDYLSKFDSIFYYYEGLKGTISSVGYHAAGMIGSPINIRTTIGLRYNKDNGGWISSCDMKAVDGVNYVKYDILSLKTLQVIKDTYTLLGRKMPRSHEINWNDKAVLDSMGDSPIGLFQFESDSSWQYLKKFGCRSVRDIAFVTAVIRPSCASFRDSAIARIANVNPNEKIDEVLKDSLGYLVYQEQQISFLQKLCGFTEGQADVVRRAIGKKSKELLDEWLPKIEAGYLANSDKPEEVAREEFQQFLKVFMDAVNYSFSYNHAIAYSMITYITAYLRYYHPFEFTTAYLNNATDEDDIKSGTALARTYGIKINNPKYGKSEAYYAIKNGEIYKGIESVLYVSAKCADALLEISKNDMSFIDVVKTALAHKAINTRQIDVLIKIDFFSEFGKARKLFEWFTRYKEYGHRKTFSKEGIPVGTENLIKSFIANNVEGFAESAKQYKIDGYKLMERMFEVMKNLDFSIPERIVNQMSYLGYIQDQELMESKVGTVASNKSKMDSYCVEFMNGTKCWYKVAEGLPEPSKGDLIVIYTEGQVKRGRYTDKVIASYDKLVLDRNKQSK